MSPEQIEKVCAGFLSRLRNDPEELVALVEYVMSNLDPEWVSRQRDHRIAGLWREGWSAQDIGDELGFSYQWVTRRLMHLGIQGEKRV